MPIAYIFMLRIKWHNKWDIHDLQMMVLAKDVDESFTHISINATLDWIIDRGYTAFYFKKNVEKPL